MLCVEFIVVTATLVIVQWYCVEFEDYFDYRTVDIVQRYCVRLEFIVVTTTVDIEQWYCVVCGVNCGYSNSRYISIVLCCVWRLLWLQQQ